MLRAIKWIILAIIAVVLIVVGVANWSMVDLRLLPGALDPDNVYTLHQMPLAVVILASIAIGILVGEFFEYVREHKHRRTAKVKRREAEELARENAALKNRLEGDSDMPKIPVR